MELTSFEAYTAMIDNLKILYRRVLSNCILNANQLKEIMTHKECLLQSYDKSIFLLIPYHASFYDCMYHTVDMETLKNDVIRLLAGYKSALSIRFSIMGEEPIAAQISSVLEKAGFALSKKLIKSIFSNTRSLNAHIACQMLDDNADNADNADDNPRYAEISDACGVLDLLMESFDPVGDNLPEIGDIIDNIKKRQVMVISVDNQIRALKYFKIHNGQCYVIYVAVKKDFRKKLYIYRFDKLLAVHLHSLGKPIFRTYGWYDASNKRLEKVNKLSGHYTDGVVIYNMIWTSPAYNIS